MKYDLRLRATAMLLLSVPLAGCVSTAISNDVPACEELIPESLLAETPAADLPDARQLPDGHDDAQPWQVGFVEQTGQLEIANARTPAVNHIYRRCLELHRDALRRSRRGFFGRLLSGAEVRDRLGRMAPESRRAAEVRIESYRLAVRRDVGAGQAVRLAP